MTLDEAREHIGHWVVYQPHPAAEREDGTITEVRGAHVFVLYDADRAPKATRAEDIELLGELF